MLNNVVLVGRVNEITQLEKFVMLTISVQKSYKNSMGGYDYLYINVFINNGSMSDNVVNYVNNQDIVGIKGHLDNNVYIDRNNIICDKITFLSSKKED